MRNLKIHKEKSRGLVALFAVSLVMMLMLTIFPQVVYAGNIALLSTATASSQYNNDYRPDMAKDGNLSTEWASLGQTTGAWIQLSWPYGKTVTRVVLRDRANLTDVIYAGTLVFSDGTSISTGGLPNDGSPKEFAFSPKTITWVKFTVDSGGGYNCGLSEFEVYEYEYKDTTPPSVTISSPASGSLITSSPLAVSGAASDNSAVSQVEVSVNSGAWSQASLAPLTNLALSSTATASSQYNNDYRPDMAKDGNLSTEWASLGQTTGAWIQLSWPSAQTVSKIVLRDRANLTDVIYAGTLAFSDGTSFSTGGLPNDGSPKVITFAARTTTWVKFIIDSGGGYNCGLSEFEVYNATADTWSVNVNLSYGNNTIAARSMDAFGNYSSSTSVSVTYDTSGTNPTVSISSPVNNSTVTSSSLTVSGAASDNVNVAKVEVSVNGGAWTQASGTNSWSIGVNLIPGPNTIDAKATDLVGNQSAVASVTVIRSPSGPYTTITFNYDQLGRKTGMADPDMGTWSYGYDANSNLTSQTDAKGQTITFTYDKANRVTKKTYGTTTYDTNYVYDNTVTSPGGKGRLYKVYGYSGGVNNQYFETYAYYDELGRPKQSRLYLETGKDWTTSTTYDAAGRVSTTTYPDGEVITYRYNKAGKLASPDGGITPAVQSSMYTSYAYVKDIGYNQMGALSSLLFGNNRTTSYAYYNDSTVEPGSGKTYTYRLKSVVTDGNVQSMSYGYDVTGNVTQVTDNINSNYSATYTYDDLSRLIGASAMVFGNLTFGYDNIGNLLLKDGKTYTYPATGTTRPHAPTGDGTYTYTYDNNGNMLTRSDGRTFTWDYDNMVSSIVDSGVTKGTYAYAEGARIKKVENGITTYYVGGSYEEEWSGGVKTHVTKYYSVGSGKAKRRDGVVSFIHTDHLGSSSRTSDANGALQYTIVYKPYGEDAYSNDTGAMDYRFTGKEKDDATGLYYYGARYYDPVLARFVSADPVQGPNRYAYVGNNPVNRIDPTGLTYYDSHGNPWLGGTGSRNMSSSWKSALDSGALDQYNSDIGKVVSRTNDFMNTRVRNIEAGRRWARGVLDSLQSGDYMNDPDIPFYMKGYKLLEDNGIEIGMEDILARFDGVGVGRLPGTEINGVDATELNIIFKRRWTQTGRIYDSTGGYGPAALVWTDPIPDVGPVLYVKGTNEKSHMDYTFIEVSPWKNKPMTDKTAGTFLKADIGHLHFEADIPVKADGSRDYLGTKLWIRGTAGIVGKVNVNNLPVPISPQSVLFERLGPYIQVDVGKLPIIRQLRGQ